MLYFSAVVAMKVLAKAKGKNTGHISELMDTFHIGLILFCLLAQQTEGES